jgi:hypothetical protein
MMGRQTTGNLVDGLGRMLPVSVMDFRPAISDPQLWTNAPNTLQNSLKVPYAKMDNFGFSVQWWQHVFGWQKKWRECQWIETEKLSIFPSDTTWLCCVIRELQKCRFHFIFLSQASEMEERSAICQTGDMRAQPVPVNAWVYDGINFTGPGWFHEPSWFICWFWLTSDEHVACWSPNLSITPVYFRIATDTFELFLDTLFPRNILSASLTPCMPVLQS